MESDLTAAIKRRVARALPGAALDHIDALRNKRRSAEQVFSAIYKKNSWGGRRGEFYSGSGSGERQVVDAYVTAVSALATEERLENAVAVDLGCGDFQVGRRLRPVFGSYVGVDVVAPLIERNSSEFGDDRTSFRHLDMTKDELPPGDVCLIRQVLQHLSNEQIGSVLSKLDQYRLVIVTEHQPLDQALTEPNIDKVHGGYIRLNRGSGVYLDRPPFSLPADRLDLLLEVPAPAHAERIPSVLRSFVYRKP